MYEKQISKTVLLTKHMGELGSIQMSKAKKRLREEFIVKKKLKISMVFLLVLTLLIPNMGVLAMTEFTGSDNTIFVQDVRAIARCISVTENVVCETEFNYNFDEVRLSIDGNMANVQIKTNGTVVEFNPIMHNSQLGRNAENTMFGVDTERSVGFELLQFTLERSAPIYSLAKPNWYMAGNDIASLVIFNYNSRYVYFFQFIINELKLPILMVPFICEDDNTLIQLELANFAAVQVDVVAESFDSKHIEISNSLTVSAPSALDGDWAETRNELPLSVSPLSGEIITDFPDSLFTNTFRPGWNERDTAWRLRHSNPAQQHHIHERASLRVYTHHNSFTSEHWHFTMRLIVTADLRWNAPLFDMDVVVTHSGWMWHCLFTSNLNWDPRTSAQRIEVNEAHIMMQINNGEFNSVDVTSITRGSRNSRIARLAIRHIPRVGAIADSLIEIFTSGDRVQTGTTIALRRPDGRPVYYVRVHENRLQRVGDQLRMELRPALTPNMVQTVYLGYHLIIRLT